jgi:hypothetical protein
MVDARSKKVSVIITASSTETMTVLSATSTIIDLMVATCEGAWVAAATPTPNTDAVVIASNDSLPHEALSLVVVVVLFATRVPTKTMCIWETAAPDRLTATDVAFHALNEEIILSLPRDVANAAPTPPT